MIFTSQGSQLYRSGIASDMIAQDSNILLRRGVKSTNYESSFIQAGVKLMSLRVLSELSVLYFSTGSTMMSFSDTFNTNCTLPTTPYHYVSSPNFRSTTDMLWSSWSSLVLFTWIVQHLNVPALREAKTWSQKCGNLIAEIAIKIMFMLGTSIAPELLIGKALEDWISARTSKEEMEDFANEDKVKWTVTHAFYANLGGFIFEFSTDTPLPDQVDPGNNSTRWNHLVVGSAQECEGPHLALAKTKAPATSSSTSLIEEEERGNIPQFVPRPQKMRHRL